MKFAPVFQTVNHVQGPLIPQGGGPGKIEGESQFMAVGTIELLIDLSGKRFTTLLAEGSREAWQVRITDVAKGPPV